MTKPWMHMTKALSLKPDLAGAWAGRGDILSEFKRYNDAFAAYDRALELEPDLEYVRGARLFAKLLVCDWTDLQAETAQLLSMVREGCRRSRRSLCSR